MLVAGLVAIAYYLSADQAAAVFIQVKSFLGQMTDSAFSLVRQIQQLLGKG